jgi:hypothetical protein
LSSAIPQRTKDPHEYGYTKARDRCGSFVDAELLITETLGPAISEEDAHAASHLQLRVRMTAALAAECEKLAADIERYRMELELSRVELAWSKNEVEGVKKRLKEVWRMNCDLL